MDRTVSAMPLGGSAAATDLSLWALFLQADWIVKAVMLLLVLASFWSWAIIFDKLIKIRKVLSDTDKFILVPPSSIYCDKVPKCL